MTMNCKASYTFLLSFLAACLAADAGTFSDSFADGLNPTYWSVLQTVSNFYSVSLPPNQVQLETSGISNPGGLQMVSIRLDLAELGGSVSNDFSVQVQFSNASFGGSSLDQVELHTSYQDGSIYFVSYDNSQGLNAHVWDGTSALGAVGLSTNGGVFSIVRTGGTVTGYFNGSALYSETRSPPLSSIEFALQDNNGSSDSNYVTFSSFSLSSATTASFVQSNGVFYYVNFSDHANFTWAAPDSVPGEPVATRLPGAPVGLVTLGGIPFNIGSNSQGKQAWHADIAANGGPGQVVLTNAVNAFGVTKAYSLINTWEGQPGPTAYAWFVFTGSAGAVYTNYLVGGTDIRDYNNGSWQNALTTSTINVFNCLKDNWGNPGRLDMQQITLPPAFATQTLTSVQLVDNGGPTVQRVVLDGLSLQSGTPPLLSIRDNNNQIQVSWQAIYGGVLQTNEDLALGKWGNYGGAVASLASTNLATLAPSRGALFFRLRLP
jgi:hypothetical protein